MSLITTNEGRKVFKKAESMMLVPYVYNSTVGGYVLGSDVYDISAIIGDSITIEQSDGDTTTKNNEFKSSPLLQCISGSKYGFTAQCLDLQNKVLKSVFGAMTVSGEEGVVAFSEDFVLIYALVRIRFKVDSLPDMFLPKVQLSSKLMIDQLKTRSSQGNIAGTAFATNVAVKNPNVSNKLLQFSSAEGGIYTPCSPVVFVPRGRSPMFLHHKVSATSEVYSTVNFDSGAVVSDINVNPTTGTWTIA